MDSPAAGSGPEFELAEQYAVPIILAVVTFFKRVLMSQFVKLKIDPSKAKDLTGIVLVLVISYGISWAGGEPPPLRESLQLSGMAAIVFKAVQLFGKYFGFRKG